MITHSEFTRLVPNRAPLEWDSQAKNKNPTGDAKCPHEIRKLYACWLEQLFRPLMKTYHPDLEDDDLKNIKSAKFQALFWKKVPKDYGEYISKLPKADSVMIPVAATSEEEYRLHFLKVANMHRSIRGKHALTLGDLEALAPEEAIEESFEDRKTSSTEKKAKTSKRQREDPNPGPSSQKRQKIDDTVDEDLEKEDLDAKMDQLRKEMAILQAQKLVKKHEKPKGGPVPGLVYEEEEPAEEPTEEEPQEEEPQEEEPQEEEPQEEEPQEERPHEGELENSPAVGTPAEFSRAGITWEEATPALGTPAEDSKQPIHQTFGDRVLPRIGEALGISHRDDEMAGTTLRGYRVQSGHRRGSSTTWEPEVGIDSSPSPSMRRTVIPNLRVRDQSRRSPFAPLGPARGPSLSPSASVRESLLRDRLEQQLSPIREAIRSTQEAIVDLEELVLVSNERQERLLRAILEILQGRAQGDV
jgi:hypothetical protein